MSRRSSRAQSIAHDSFAAEEEQRREFVQELARLEQELADREMAERLQAEFNEQPTPPAHGSARGRGRGRGNGGRPMAARRGGGGGLSPRRPAVHAGRRRRADEQAGGPIPTERRAPSVEVISPTRRRRPRRSAAARGRGLLRFNGNRLEAIQGNSVIDVTDDAHFPSDDEDSDYDATGDPGPEPVDDDVVVIEDDDDLDLQPLNRRNAHRTVEETIEYVYNNDPHRDVGIDYADVYISGSDDEDVGYGMRPERNHITQPIFEEDREMYDEELALFRDDEETTVPPPKTTMRKGKPMEPDSTWGDCVMCSAPPVMPKGCNKCLQFLGCSDCVNRWHQARKPTMEGSSCPLCRASWPCRGPYVSLMPTILKKREAEKARTAGASTSGTSGPSIS